MAAFPSGMVALAALILGCGAALGHAPWDLWYLSLVAFAGAFHLFNRTTVIGTAAWIGWLFGLGHFAVALSWIVEPFLVDIARYGWLAPFAIFLLSGGLALFWALAFGLARRIGGVLSLVCFCTGAEMLRSIVFTGFPWASIGQTLIATPILQLASFGGVHVLTALVLATAAMTTYSGTVLRVVMPIATLGLAWAAGAHLATGPQVESSDKIIRLLQPNAAQHLKWDPEMIPVFYNRLLEMSRASGDTKPDLIVWPETALAYRLDSGGAAAQQITEAAQGIPVVLGVNDRTEDRIYNALALLSAQGEIETRYYKHHLVPFGEYLPFGEFLSKIGIHGLAAQDGAGFSAGPGPELINLPGIGTALPLICYELIFPRNLRGVPRPDMILQITNDAWFGNFSGPYQHLAQARLRAVEQGLPLLRSANTGITAVIGPRGEVIQKLGLNETGYLDATVPGALPSTIYARYGDWLMRGVLVALLLLITLRRARHSD